MNSIYEHVMASMAKPAIKPDFCSMALARFPGECFGDLIRANFASPKEVLDVQVARMIRDFKGPAIGVMGSASNPFMANNVSQKWYDEQLEIVGSAAFQAVLGRYAYLNRQRLRDVMASVEIVHGVDGEGWRDDDGPIECDDTSFGKVLECDGGSANVLLSKLADFTINLMVKFGNCPRQLFQNSEFSIVLATQIILVVFSSGGTEEIQDESVKLWMAYCLAKAIRDVAKG
ncbi:MAG: hypothetical protein Q4E11_08600 [Corynebacterium sp.]|uniref:hypothetical protein n=1 Tax=Corynebacterium sp. TaxID=1720 RepID=UPI0026DB113A|nr:hypothetical protein [Corynebacterium sp.]MDO5030625.1 hypothetical protein [Corynebacterium sp.]